MESPTHEIRADAAPSASSAESIIVTLANRHTFDRPVEILIHPSGTVHPAGAPEAAGGREEVLIPEHTDSCPPPPHGQGEGRLCGRGEETN